MSLGTGFGWFVSLSNLRLGGTPMRKRIIPFQKYAPPPGEDWLDLNRFAQLRLA